MDAAEYARLLAVEAAAQALLDRKGHVRRDDLAAALATPAPPSPPADQGAFADDDFTPTDFA